jgi:hypothetical protein
MVTSPLIFESSQTTARGIILILFLQIEKQRSLINCFSALKELKLTLISTFQLNFDLFLLDVCRDGSYDDVDDSSNDIYGSFRLAQTIQSERCNLYGKWYQS